MHAAGIFSIEFEFKIILHEACDFVNVFVCTILKMLEFVLVCRPPRIDSILAEQRLVHWIRW